MSNQETPGGDPWGPPPTSPPDSWGDDPTVVGPFGAPPQANPLPSGGDPFSAPSAAPLEAPWATGPGPSPYGAPPYGGPPPGFGGPGPSAPPPPGYVPSNPYAGTPYDVGPRGLPPYGAPTYAGVPYGELRATPRTGIAVGSLVCGIVGLAIALVPVFGLVGGLLALVAIPLGFIGLGAAKRQGGAGRGLAIGGIVTGVLTIVVCVAWVALIFLVGTTTEDDPIYQEEPMDGFCDEDRLWEDPDC